MKKSIDWTIKNSNRMVRLISENGEVIVDTYIQILAQSIAKTSVDMFYSFITGGIACTFVNFLNFY